MKNLSRIYLTYGKKRQENLNFNFFSTMGKFTKYYAKITYRIALKKRQRLARLVQYYLRSRGDVYEFSCVAITQFN
jgi:ssDNA-specific exonuclease RecJ